MVRSHPTVPLQFSRTAPRRLRREIRRIAPLILCTRILRRHGRGSDQGKFRAPRRQSLPPESRSTLRPQVRVGSLCLPVGAARTFRSRAKLTAKNTGKKFDSRSPRLREALENPCALGTWKYFRGARTVQVTGNEDRDIRKRFSKNRERERRHSLYFVYRQSGLSIVERFASEPARRPASTRPPNPQEGRPARATTPVGPSQGDGLNANSVVARRGRWRA